MAIYDLIIFDFDGTVLKTNKAIEFCILQSLKEMNLEIKAGIESEIQNLIATGNTLADTFSQIGIKHEEIAQYVKKYREIYAVESDTLCSVFDGVYESLASIARSSAKLLLLSNKGELALKTAVKTFRLEQYFDYVIGERNGIKPKPHPSVFHSEIAPLFGLKHSDRLLMVGDTAADIRFAHAIEADSCWAKYGFGYPEACRPLLPTFEVDSIKEVVEVVLGP